MLKRIRILAFLFIHGVCFAVNPSDPYESINRQTHEFNRAFDATFLKPLARFYKAIIPESIRTSVNNFYLNIGMIPTTANDLLQAEFHDAIKDVWRFAINSTFGLAGLFDVADRSFSLPPHYNDLGLTFAKWGDKKSPYIVLPFLGPSTIRDAMGMLFEYTFLTPYPYINNQPILYSVLGLRYIDLRSQLFDTERLMQEALDPYAFVRDAYLQHRHFRINGSDSTGSFFVVDNDLGDNYVDDEAKKDKLPDRNTSF